MLAGLLAPGNRNAMAVGVVLIALGYFVFALNDALGKYLVATFTVAQVVLIRAIGSFIILGPLLVYQNEQPFRNVHRPGWQIARAVLAAGDSALFYAACVYLPLADVMAFYMAGPIYVSVISHFMLGEHVGWRRWTAILVGFVGVLIALRPSTASFSLPALFAVTGSISYSFSLVLNKVLAKTGDASLVTYHAVASMIGAGALCFFSWTPMGWGGLAAMLLLGVIGAIAHLMVTRSLKLVPVAVVAPFQYTLLLWGIVLGVIFFGDWPAPHIIFGSGVIILAGLFILHRKANTSSGLSEADVPRDLT